MIVRRFNSIRAAERIIRAVHETARPYQRYEVLRACERGHWRCAWRHPLARMWNWLYKRPFRVYSVENDAGQVVCVAPLQRENGNAWKIADGDFVPLNYADFLYADGPQSEREQAFSCLLTRLNRDGLSSVCAHALADDSPTRCLLTHRPHVERNRHPSVAIPLDGPRADTPLRLGANARSNLHKAQNRLRRQGRVPTFEFWSNCGLGASLASSSGRLALRTCRAFYWKRLGNRYGHRGFSAWFFFNFCNHTTLAVHSPDAVLAVLRIDGQAAAFLQGYVDARRHTLAVPRIAMNDQWAAFSPGWLLVDACARWMRTHSDLRVLDLTRGDERYKHDLGGVDSVTHDIEFSTGNA